MNDTKKQTAHLIKSGRVEIIQSKINKMTAIQLYKFVTESKKEYHKQPDGDVFLFVDVSDIEAFNKMIDASITDDGGIECIMKKGYFVFEMAYICEYYGIALSDVFTEESNV